MFMGNIFFLAFVILYFIMYPYAFSVKILGVLRCLFSILIKVPRLKVKISHSYTLKKKFNLILVPIKEFLIGYFRTISISGNERKLNEIRLS